MTFMNSNKYLASLIGGFIIATGLAVLLSLAGAQQSVYSVVALLGFTISSYMLYRLGNSEQVLFYALITMAVEALIFPFFVYLGIRNQILSNMNVIIYLANGLGIEKASAAVLAVSVVMALGIGGLAFLATYFISAKKGSR
jgi:Ni,Fe-hydrogenase I cytochrome b subunit